MLLIESYIKKNKYILTENKELIENDYCNFTKDDLNVHIQMNTNLNEIKLYGRTYLHLFDINTEILVLSLLNGFNVNEKDFYGNSLLHWNFNNLKNLKILISYGININSVNKYNETVLMYAVKFNKYEIVDYILKLKPDLSIRTIKNLTVMDYATNTTIKRKLLNYINKLQYGKIENVENIIYDLKTTIGNFNI